MNCPAHLWSQKNAQTTPVTPANDPQGGGGTRAKVPEASSEDKSKKVPLKPVEPIQIPQDNPKEDDRLKQLESPETVELIKTFEITDPVPDKPPSEPIKLPATPEPPAKLPTPPVVVAVKPEPIVAPVPTPAPVDPPKKAPATDPTDSLFSPPAQEQGNKANKDIKEATSDFLAQEFNQPKKSSKRYTKSRQKNNHS